MKVFFDKYVICPHHAWIKDELCEWKAFAVVNGLNALVEHAFISDNPTLSVRDKQFGGELGEYRKNLPNAEDHAHIRFVAEVFKHLERREMKDSPNTLGEMERQTAGAFSPEFSQSFDVTREQLGFPFQRRPGDPPTWVPLREVVDRCLAYWKTRC